MKDPLTPAMQTLEALDIPYRVFRHARPPASLADAARERSQELGQVVRSIVFRSGTRYFLLLLPGGCRAEWSRLRKALGLRRVTLATPEEVLRVTGAPVGAVSPWGWPHPPDMVLVDRRVFRYDEISLGSGLPGVALLLRSEDLRRALPPNSLIGDFSEPTS